MEHGREVFDPVVGGDFDQGRAGCSGVESQTLGTAAAIHEVGDGGDLSGDGGEPGFRGGIEPRDASQQASGVGVAWVGE